MERTEPRVPRIPAAVLAAGLALAVGCAEGWSTPVETVELGTRNEVVVDDQHGEPAFSTTGDDWTTWGTNGYGYDGNDSSYHYLSHTLGGDDRRGTATWSPTLPESGTYRIETWFRRTGNRTADADHFIHDAYGGETHIVVDQTGDGASGWLDLGEYGCEAGFGGCIVVLDGTDDDESDEANAMRFVLVDSEPPPPPPECDQEFAAGQQHELVWPALSASGSGWEDEHLSAGEPDGAEAHSPNVDEGEFLAAGGWDICDPAGDETFDWVRLEVLSRMQYESGEYALILALDGGGAAQTTYSHEAQDWDMVDVTGDREEWSWTAVEVAKAYVTLHDHPGGARDSDAWVDAFRVRVGFTTLDPPADDDDTGGDDDDDTVDPGDDDTAGDPGPGPGNHDPAWENDCSCSAAGGPTTGVAAMAALALFVATGRRHSVWRRKG